MEKLWYTLRGTIRVQFALWTMRGVRVRFSPGRGCCAAGWRAGERRGCICVFPAVSEGRRDTWAPVVCNRRTGKLLIIITAVVAGSNYHVSVHLRIVGPDAVWSPAKVVRGARKLRVERSRRPLRKCLFIWRNYRDEIGTGSRDRGYLSRSRRLLPLRSWIPTPLANVLPRGMFS